MPQFFQVLKCYKCSVFQVHQTKKSPKWECKLCGEKQSVKRNYGLGTGKECRLHVQKLNGIRGEIDEQNKSIEYQDSDEELQLTESCKPSINRSNKSKWSNFIDQKEHEKESTCNESMYLEDAEVVLESMYLEDAEVVLEIPAKKRKKFKTPKVISHSKTNELEYHRNESLFNSASKCNSNTKSEVISSKPVGTLQQNIVQDKEKYLKAPQSEISSNNREIQTNKKQLKPYLPPKVDKSSKWAHFDEEYNDIGEDESITIDNPLANQSICKKNVSNSLFTLCDESELDDVLNF